MKLTRVAFLAALAGLGLASAASAQSTLTDAITYQGRLTDAGLPANGIYDFRFQLFDASAGGVQQGPTLARENVNCVGGLFTVNDLNFNQAGDNVFGENERRWLQIQVRLGTSGGGFTTLSARQELTAAPYALNLRLPMSQTFAGTVANGALIDLSNTGIGRALLLSSVDSPLYTLRTNAADTAPGGIYSVSAGTGHALIGDNSGATTSDATIEGRNFGDGGYAGRFSNFGAANAFPALVAATSGTGPAVHADGSVQVGSAADANGSIVVHTSVGTGSNVVLDDYFDLGARLALSSEDGFNQFRVEPDANEEGGFLLLARNNTTTGFFVDGNSGGTQNPTMSLLGSGSDVFLNTNASGNGAVQLTANAISSAETLDEAGTAAATNGGGLVTLTGAVDTILSRTITVPAAGYVLAIATCQANATHTTGTSSSCNFGVSDTVGVLPGNQDVAAVVPSALPSATFNSPVTVQGVFSVGVGANTFYFLGDENSGAWSCNDMQLSLVYVPTAYGTVDAPVPPPLGLTDDRRNPKMGPMLAGALAAERAQGAAFAARREQLEAEEMRRQMAMINDKLEQSLREQESMRNQIRELRRATEPVRGTPGDAEPTANRSQK